MNKTLKKNIPKQKRSEDTRQKILRAGFDLFNEKGYHATNTTEIAAHAGVSVGGLYGRYKDKREIFYDSYDELFASRLAPLTKILETADFDDYDTFVDNLIDTYIMLYKENGRAIKELRNMMENDSEMSDHFVKRENSLIKSFLGALPNHSVSIENLYVVYFLLNSLGLENSNHIHDLADLDKLKASTIKLIIQLLK